jgi:hypothetical protein
MKRTDVTKFFVNRHSNSIILGLAGHTTKVVTVNQQLACMLAFVAKNVEMAKQAETMTKFRAPW